MLNEFSQLNSMMKLEEIILQWFQYLHHQISKGVNQVYKKIKKQHYLSTYSTPRKKTTSIKGFIYHHHPHQHIVIVNANIIYFIFTLMCHVIKV